MNFRERCPLCSAPLLENRTNHIVSFECTSIKENYKPHYIMDYYEDDNDPDYEEYFYLEKFFIKFNFNNKIAEIHDDRGRNLILNTPIFNFIDEEDLNRKINKIILFI